MAYIVQMETVFDFPIDCSGNPMPHEVTVASKANALAIF
jgi:hypothetical protein